MSGKAIFLVRAHCLGDFEVWSRQVLEEAVPALLEQRPERLKVGVTDAAPPFATLLPLQSYPLAMFSIWTDDRALLQRYRDALTILRGKIEGYLVYESLPVAYRKDWHDGEPTPGLVLLTLLKQNPRISRDEFMYEWHGRHTPKAIRIHPLWQYVRNVIAEPLPPDAPDFQGIVEENYRSRADCLNPIRMFGGWKAPAGMLEVYRHVTGFLDLENTQNFLLTEYHIRS
jgi:hypothetical protein